MSEYTIDGESVISAVTAGTEFHCYDADSSKRTKKATASQLWLPSGRFRYLTAPVGWAAYSSTGTNTTLVAGTMYWADVVISRVMTVTGIGVLNGATVGTDKGLVALFDYNGNLLANSATAGATTSGANAFQQYAFTLTYTIVTPGQFFIGYQSNGTTDTIRTIAASTWADVLTKSATGSFGAIPTLTVPTTFTADKGPYAYIY
jgi:hypothetical protein